MATGTDSCQTCQVVRVLSWEDKEDRERTLLRERKEESTHLNPCHTVRLCGELVLVGVLEELARAVLVW